MKRMLGTVILLLIVGSAYAEIYTWKDENGRTVYSQTQRRGAQAVELKPQPQISSESETDKTKTKTTQQYLETLEQSNDALEQARADAEQKKQREAELKQRCQDARKSIELLQRGGTTRFQKEDGSWTHYTPEQRADQRKGIQKLIDENCQ